MISLYFLDQNILTEVDQEWLRICYEYMAWADKPAVCYKVETDQAPANDNAQPTTYPRANPQLDGTHCRKCRTFYDYAEADGPDGLLTCHGCKQLASVFK